MADSMMANANDSPWPGDPQVSHFSDSIIISRVVGKQSTGIEFAEYLQSVIQNLLNFNFLVRGGVTVGLLYHKAAIAYGPALIRAYELEQSAIYPRVILDSSLGTEWSQGVKYEEKNGALIGIKNYWRKDYDGFNFIDFLHPLFQSPGVPVNPDMVRRVLNPVKEIISNGLRNQKYNIKIRQKYHWTASYFNDVCSEYSDSDVDRINLDVF